MNVFFGVTTQSIKSEAFAAALDGGDLLWERRPRRDRRLPIATRASLLQTFPNTLNIYCLDRGRVTISLRKAENQFFA